MKQIASVAVLASVLAIPSCLADVSDEPIGDAVQPGLSRGIGGTAPLPRDPVGDARAWLREHPGPCSDACFDAWAHLCGDADVCDDADAQPYDAVSCVGVGLTCLDVWRADHGEVAGLSECRQSCEQQRASGY